MNSLTGFQPSSISILGEKINTLSKTLEPSAVRYCSRIALISATVFPLFDGPRKIPVQGTVGTTPSLGCFEVKLGFGNSLTGPMLYPERLVALEAHAALWIAGGGCDLFAQLRGHAVQLALGLLVAAA